MEEILTDTDWQEINRDVKTLDSISYSEVTYKMSVSGGVLYRVDWYVVNLNGQYLDSGKTLTHVPKKIDNKARFNNSPTSLG